MGKDTKKKLIRDQQKTSTKPIKKPGKSEAPLTESQASPAKQDKEKKPKKVKHSSEETKAPEVPAEEKPKSAKKEKKSPPPQDDEDMAQDVPKRPGQKHVEPSLDDPTRAFYESLYEQNPDSEMAQKYCLDHGLVPEDIATSLVAKFKAKRNNA